MMLTNFLPNGGNGTFKIHAIAVDADGHQVTLGVKTITLDNLKAVKPFGALDAPAPGGIASGSNFRNTGWVLTPIPNAIPTDGSTIRVIVDGVILGNPTYNIYREDIANYFPGYSNSDGAHAYFYFDTTNYANGVHTISWSATDDAGNSDGIGSRYFSIQNTGSSSSATADTAWYSSKPAWLPDFLKLPVDGSGSVVVSKGHRQNTDRLEIYPDDNGNITIDITELQRLEVNLAASVPGLAPLGPAASCPRWTGYQLVGNQIRPLPIGSFLDTVAGKFFWLPGPGFVGEFRLIFIKTDMKDERQRTEIIIRIWEKGSVTGRCG